MSAFFVTATGTDIGKTYVTAGLLRHLRSEGASAIKPVVSGFTAESAAMSDPVQLLEAMGEAVTAETLAQISPWRFAEPLSPDMAAAREGRAVDCDALVEFCRARVFRAEGPFFVEGVGGVMVPLDAHHTVRDWMAALGLPVVLVAGSYLGTISHTLTALDVLARARAQSCGCGRQRDRATAPCRSTETMTTLRRFAGAIPIVALRRGADDAEFAALWQILRVAH